MKAFQVLENSGLSKREDFLLGMLVGLEMNGAESQLKAMGLTPKTDYSKLMVGSVIDKKIEERILSKSKGRIENLTDLKTVITPLVVSGTDDEPRVGGIYFMVFNQEISEQTFVLRFIIDLRPPHNQWISFIVSEATAIGCPCFSPQALILASGPGIVTVDCSQMPNSYLQCLCDCWLGSTDDVRGPIVGTCITCLISIAALPESAGLSAVLAIPACSACYILDYGTLAACTLGCAVY